MSEIKPAEIAGLTVIAVLVSTREVEEYGETIDPCYFMYKSILF